MKCASWLLATRWPGLADLPGDLGQERFESGAHTTVFLEDGRADDCGSVCCSFLALGDGGGFAHQTGGLHTERGGNLNVNELVSVLDTWFGDSHVHSRAVFGVNGRVVQRPVRRAMFAISSRKALCLAERACPHGHVVACLPSLSRAAPHSVPSRFLFLHRLPGSHTGLRNRVLVACWNAELCTIGCWRLEAGGIRRRRAHWRCQVQPGVCCWHQCDHAGLWWLC